MFERNETGDRAIDPFYPSFWVGAGSRLVLTDPAYPEFAGALREVLSEKTPRPVIARALMESDLWAAYDILFGPFLLDDEKELGRRRQETLDLLARLLRKIALTPDEIKSLPDNYSAAVKRQSFPDVFRKESGWVEVERFAPRTHDSNADFRRVSRVFLKPAHPPLDMQQFLNAERNPSKNTIADLAGIALITQMLLIDTHGNVKPTKLTTEIQVRRFQKTDAGPLEKTSVRVAEISRKRLMGEPETGGMVAEDESSAAYLGGYGFAEGQPVQPVQSNVTGLPVQVKLRTRCAGCHGENLAVVHTFSIAACTANCPPGYRTPAVRELDASGNQAAEFDIREKKKRADFEALRKYFP